MNGNLHGSFISSPSTKNLGLQKYDQLSGGLRNRDRISSELSLLSLKNEIDVLRTQNESLDKTVKELKVEIQENEKKIHELQTYTRRENIEIVGIPESVKQKDLESTVINILKEIGVKVSSYNKASCHRLKLSKGKKCRNVIVRFINRKNVYKSLKNSWK